MDDTQNLNEDSKRRRLLTRREVLKLGGVVALGSTLAGTVLAWRSRSENGHRASVFIGKADTYDSELTSLILDGLKSLNFSQQRIRGKRVLLKPNLVETSLGHSHINTHPAMIAAAAEAFRTLGAAEVLVAEGQGHRRDSWLVLEDSGMSQILDEANLRFVDLNHDDVSAVPNVAGWTDMPKLYLPRTVQSADIVVSMPKLKTHHWTGVTCSMKNMFGVMPGLVYGWPKNVLHHAGIHQSILDINAAVRPHLAIVDGIVGMEGDGPIMGQPKHLGAVVLGENLVAVDATCTRLMKLNPQEVGYLAAASGRYGPIRPQHIEQRGESILTLQSRFKLIDAPHLNKIGQV